MCLQAIIAQADDSFESVAHEEAETREVERCDITILWLVLKPMFPFPGNFKLEYKFKIRDELFLGKLAERVMQQGMWEY